MVYSICCLFCLSITLREKKRYILLSEAIPSGKAASKGIRKIACRKSLELLEDNFAGKKLPPPECKTKEID